MEPGCARMVVHSAVEICLMYMCVLFIVDGVVEEFFVRSGTGHDSDRDHRRSSDIPKLRSEETER